MRKRKTVENGFRVKKKIMSGRYIALTYCSMSLLVGIQTGIIVFPGFMSLNDFIRVAIVMIYWALVAALFASFYIEEYGYFDDTRVASQHIF